MSNNCHKKLTMFPLKHIRPFFESFQAFFTFFYFLTAKYHNNNRVLWYDKNNRDNFTAGRNRPK
ncbi:hypothetical protein GT23_3130 [Parageobacillus thermoglucosidasius]|nr:hypothetical protein GT23_3130 [Parageobacillus thermoglucosidasius]